MGRFIQAIMNKREPVKSAEDVVMSRYIQLLQASACIYEELTPVDKRSITHERIKSHVEVDPPRTVLELKNYIYELHMQRRGLSGNTVIFGVMVEPKRLGFFHDLGEGLIGLECEGERISLELVGKASNDKWLKPILKLQYAAHTSVQHEESTYVLQIETPSPESLIRFKQVVQTLVDKAVMPVPLAFGHLNQQLQAL